VLFNSLQFLVFFPIVVMLYFALPHRWRWAMLLAASYYFYAVWKVEYLVLIVASTLIDYVVALQLARTTRTTPRRLLLALSLVTNLGILFAFKYFTFASDSVREVMNRFNIMYEFPELQVLLPVGISFYTFQSLSYTIDVYRGARPPERHLGVFALYVAYFPQLVAGPIERSTHLLPQFREKQRFEWARAIDGAQLMLWGYFKKLVIADRLALYVNEVFGNSDAYGGAAVVIAAYFFAFQIYCDFSGYSDIAIGAARIMGYDIMQNFRRPYLAASIAEFWRRWHISLSTWFRDYLYIPLGGNRVSPSRWAFNIFAVFTISGLWHGAAWTFVIWGALHGAYYLIGHWTTPMRDRLNTMLRLHQSTPHHVLRVIITFHLVTIAWFFFRAPDIAQAGAMIISIFDTPFVPPTLSFGMTPEDFAVSVALIPALLLLESIQRPTDNRSPFAETPKPIRYTFYYATAMSILIFGKFTQNAFIYFQF